MERKLTAILSADVAGYSRLVEDDDEATIRTLTTYRQLMRERIDAHRGRVVDAPGDNLLAEFASVVDAVRCAVEIQETLLTQNTGQEPTRRMFFRMGINVGDVVIEDGRLYGDGVNIAARLEGLAEPGGICISGNAYEQVENKLDINFEFIGEQPVKNITKPVSVWRTRSAAVDTSPELAGTAVAAPAREPLSDDFKSPPSRTRHLLIAGGVIVAIVAAFLATGRPGDRSNEPSVPSMADEQAAAIPADNATNSAGTSGLTTERPSIIVLPFTNISDDPDQDYFSDGITEDITTDLSKLHSLIVIPSNSAFKYKGTKIDPEILQRDLGIRYLLEGSVRKAGDQVRINARLVDVVAGENLWGERYDRALTDIFALQDDIRKKILTALRVNLTQAEKERFAKAPTTNLEAYDFYLRAQEMSHRARQELRPEFMTRAEELFRKAIELDPDYAAAYAALGLTEWLTWNYDWGEDPEAALRSSLEHFEKSHALDDSNQGILRWVLVGYYQLHQHDRALALAREFVERAPLDPVAHRALANVLLYSGEYAEADEALEKSAALAPPAEFSYWLNGMVLNLLNRNDEAIAVLKEATLRSPNYLTNHVILTAIYAKTGRLDEARQQAQEVLRISPRYDVAKFASRVQFADESVTEGYIAALRQAGLE
jgi:adenylate cyclase